jgi:hypothetical protein
LRLSCRTNLGPVAFRGRQRSVKSSANPPGTALNHAVTASAR